MKNNIQKILISILASSLAAALFAGCSLSESFRSQSGSSPMSSQSESSTSGQPEKEAYSIDIPATGWNQASPGMWAAQEDSKVLTNVRIWVVFFQGQTREEAEKSLSDDDYQTADGTIQREEEGISTKVALHESGSDTWGVFYSYPTGEAEKWESKMSEIAGTFQLSGN